MKAYQLAVFVDSAGDGGDWLTVVDDRENDINETARMELATSYGHAETSFVESFDPARVTFYNPVTGEVPFAGQPMVGTAWLLGKLLGYVPNNITCGAGHVETWQEGDITWLRKILPDFPSGKSSNSPL
ncbi:PhzF family phenazine biosynthesis protein [Candidatus Saccharibacteria bacterium]|nr:MAG: PhzF family phenazine biosynthesis protein [Candidatus Saccharibacteria bacterium]